MDADKRERLARALSPRLTRYIPHTPTPKQRAGLCLNHIREVLYGGAAGGGKSDWLLMGALQYVDLPGYSALLLRRTYPELKLEGGLLERADEWLAGTDAIWHGQDLNWTFPSGAVLQFGYLETPRDHLRYQGSNWHYIGFDELTQFREHQYRYLFSRLRRLEGVDIPIRMRSGSNPGGPGHTWVRNRFGIYVPEEEQAAHDAAIAEAAEAGEEPPPEPRRLCHRPVWIRGQGRTFLPAKLEDNPHLDREEYERSLGELDAVTRRQLHYGDWDAKEPGEYFRRDWFEIVDRAPSVREAIRYWDLAATEPSSRNPNPDYTVGLKLGITSEGQWVILDIRRGRWRSQRVEAEAQQAAKEDGRHVAVWMEQEPGASGKQLVSHWQRNVLPGYQVKGHAPADAKHVRARIVASKAEAGLVQIVRGAYLTEFLDEAEDFPPEGEESHDDQVDALSGAFANLIVKSAAPATTTKHPWK
jgi:predicted phage terminase large subunit-like protein